MLALTAGLLVPRVWSQPATDNAQEAASSTEPELIIAGAQPTENLASKGKSSAGTDTLSVDFPDEDIRNILRNVADLFELNLVVPDTLQGRTSIKLRDVSWRQIFEVVLTPINFTYVEDGNIIKIVSNDSLLQEPVSTEVFVLNYALAADIMPTIASLVDPAVGGKIMVDTRSNALVITERPTKMNRIRPIIDSLDKATDQVMIESKFVEVTNADVKNIGVNWSSLNGYQIGVGGINQQWSRGNDQTTTDGRTGNSSNNSTTTGQNGTNTVNGNNNGVTNAVTNGTTNGTTVNNTGATTSSTSVSSSGDLLTFDPVTNLPTVTVVPPINNTTTTTNPGSSQTNTTSGTTTADSVTTTTGTTTAVTTTLASDLSTTASNAVSNLFGLTNTGSQSRLASAVFSASDFNLILSALKTNSDTKLVSNPTVVTLNNTEAIINIGKDYPIPNYTYNQQTGAYEVSGFEYKSIGIILKVTPQVNSRGFIKLTVEPEVSSSNETANFGNANIPVVTIRKTKTQVSLQDGFTMGIGGLMENTQQNVQTKVPVLGSIPLLGRLFRSDSVNDTTRNLIIFITAKTISAEGASIEEVFDSRRVRQLKMQRDELPGYRDGSDPFLPLEPTVSKAK
ncbi:MAG: hypothetical protein K9M98_08750 [Cephaloticoccus sp.]|nr:hypothetical protein [Cephaloticoccus sp.]MCF7760579.1 hypothetical protein [Cephaloticoccus sp.]